MRNVKGLMLVAMVAGFVLVAGCQKVAVMDESGKGIAFAKVQVTSHGGEGASMPIMTDMLGTVLLPTNLAEPDAREWLIVSKNGYETRRVHREKESDMTVTLQASKKLETKPEAKSESESEDK